MNDKKRIAAVVGPTASGKTALAVQLARHYDGEVISADSMQIYKGMDIAVAMPTADEKMGIPHHLMDFLPPEQPFSVAEYVTLANAAADDILSRGRLPILCGGTGLYVRSFLENITFAPDTPDPALREELNRRFETDGAQALLRELAEFDPECAAKLHPANRKRIVRAIEVYRSTGITMTEHIARSRNTPSPFELTAIGITFADRQKLYDRIDQRVDSMLQNGLLDEARRFFAGSAGKTSAMVSFANLLQEPDFLKKYSSAPDEAFLQSEYGFSFRCDVNLPDNTDHGAEVLRFAVCKGDQEEIAAGNRYILYSDGRITCPIHTRLEQNFDTKQYLGITIPDMILVSIDRFPTE